MNRGSRRLLAKTVKWVLVPLALLVVGYLYVGPVVSDWLNKSNLETAGSSN